MKKLFIIILLLASLIPPIFFAARAAFPLDKPEFNGLTYYQFLDWQALAYAQREEQFNVPQDERGVCASTRYFYPISIGMLMSQFYALSGMFPGLRAVIDPRDQAVLPEPGRVNLFNYLPAAWEIYEEINWDYQISTVHNALVVACRIPVNPPTPEQFAALKAAQP